MNEKDMNWILMLAGVVLAVIAGLGAVILVVITAIEGLRLIIPAILLAAAAVGGGVCATYFGRRTAGRDPVFDNAVEREVLTPKQRKELKRARGEIVMEKALVDIEHERQNIVHKQLEASHDPDKPPHQTSFSNGGVTDQRKPLPPRKSFDDDDDVLPPRMRY